MDKTERKLEQEKTEHQLEKQAARLRMLDANARQAKAEGAMAEISGLQSLHDRIRAQLTEWKDADEASVEEFRDQVRRGIDALTRQSDAAADRFERLGDATDRWFDAEAEQIGAAVDMLDARLGEEEVKDKQAALSAKKELQAAWEEAGKKAKELKAASKDKKVEARRALEESLGKMKRKLQDLGARFKGHAGTTEKRT